MNGLSDVIRNHIDYTIWATGRLLDAGMRLETAELQHDFGTADKSVQGTLMHLLRAEQAWFRRVQKPPTGMPAAALTDDQWGTMTEEWTKLHQSWRDWASHLSDIDAEALLEYPDSKGNQWKQPVWHIILHVVNHSTHHRGQVSGFLRALGKVPPPLDFIAFTRGQS